MTLVFVFWLYWRHFRVVYGAWQSKLAYFGLFLAALVLDDFGLIELAAYLAKGFALGLWAQLTR